MRVRIEDECGAFNIIVDGKRFHIDQEDTHELLVEVFAALGIEAEYEAVY